MKSMHKIYDRKKFKYDNIIVSSENLGYENMEKQAERSRSLFSVV